jgi:proteasome lid subunit RPN8/RPN11
MTANNTIASPDQDLAAIGRSDWPARRMPVSGCSTQTPVIIKRSALNDIHDHGRSSQDIEVCGVLIGNVYDDAGKPFVHIQGCIRGNHAAGKSAQVTFTADTWNYIQNVLDKQHPDKRILGWYHTHPGYGIFLSDMDVFIHKNFFSLPWHTAFVYDPKASEEGLFAWRGGQIASETFVVEEDVAQNDAPAAMQVAKPGGATPPGTVLELTARLQSLEQRQKWLLAGLALCALLAIAWPLLVTMLVPALKAEVSATDPISIASLRQPVTITARANPPEQAAPLVPPPAK